MTPRGARTVTWTSLTALLFGATLLLILTGSASAAIGEKFQQPNNDSYPVTTQQDPFGYPAGTEPVGEPETSDTPSGPGGLPTFTVTPGPSLTTAVDVFGTEDAQMRDSLITPPSSPTPGETITPAHTPTISATSTDTALAAGEKSAEKQGFQMDWGFFVIGFIIPVLVGCGYVLYLLDRQPGFFSGRR